MKKFVSVITAVALSAGVSKSQVLTNYSYSQFYEQFKMTEYRQNVGMKSEVDGTPYETEDFNTGNVITTNNIRYTGVPLRLNLYSNEMEFRGEDGQIFCIGAPEFIDSITVGKNKFVYAPYAMGPKTMRSYFQVLFEGKIILLLKKNVILKPAEPPAAYKEAIPATFVRNPDEFYLRILPAEAKRINSKKELQEVLTDYSPKIDDFIKKNKIRFTKKGDMTMLAEFINSL